MLGLNFCIFCHPRTRMPYSPSLSSAPSQNYKFLKQKYIFGILGTKRATEALLSLLVSKQQDFLGLFRFLRGSHNLCMGSGISQHRAQSSGQGKIGHCNLKDFQIIFHAGEIQRVWRKPCSGAHRRECHTRGTDRTGGSDWKIKDLILIHVAELSLMNISIRIWAWGMGKHRLNQTTFNKI